MGLSMKLQIPEGVKTCIVDAPEGFAFDGPTTRDAKVGAVLVFVKDSGELAAKAGPAIESARADRLTWIAYPKAGQLGTDLSRDILWKKMLEEKVRPVRQVSLDDVWSALRFRPG